MNQIKLGGTSNIIEIVLKSTVDGQGLTGLVFGSSGLRISTKCNNEASATAYTAAGSTIETISTLGTFAAPTATKCRFKEVDSTNHKGLYQFMFADARFAVSGAKSLVISISGATSLDQTNYEIELVGYDPLSALAVQTKLDTVEGLASGSSGFVATKAVVDAITAKTTNLPSNPASQTKLDTVEGLASGASGFVALSSLLTAIEGTGFVSSTMSLSAAFAAAITSQGIADAFKLAPTTGTPASLSAYDRLTNLLTNLKLQKNTAGQFVYFFLRDVANPKVGLAALASVCTVTRAIDQTVGFGAATGTLIALGSGYFVLVTSAADTNGTSILYRLTHNTSLGIEDYKIAYTHV